MKTLEILIPVFNQANAIVAHGRRLEELHCALAPELSISLSDNASTDGLGSVVGQHMPSTRVTSQSENVGMEGNIRTLVNSATAEFVWILGAGDYPVGDVTALMRDLKAAPLNFAVFLQEEEGGMHGYSPSICGTIWRTKALKKVLEQPMISPQPQTRFGRKWQGAIWPHVSWSYLLQLNGHGVMKLQNMEQVGWRDQNDWSATAEMYPFALELLLTLSLFHDESPGVVELEDLQKARRACATWFTQDLMMCKVDRKWEVIVDLFSRISLRDLSSREILNLMIAQLAPRSLLLRRKVRKQETE